MANKKIKICPHCGSTNIKLPPAVLDVNMTRPDFCEDYRQRGIFPEIEPSKIGEFRKKLGRQLPQPF
jgi:hypothetical protein